MKKKWITPELVVLVRVRADERVLGACKSQTGMGPSRTRAGCRSLFGDRACDTLANS
jgi:hypothetical protein